MIGWRLHVGGRVHRIGRSVAPWVPSPVSFENEVSGDLDDRAILVSGDDVDEDERLDVLDEVVDERRGVNGRARLPIVVAVGGECGVAIGSITYGD